MRYWILGLLMMINSAWAQLGQVTELIGTKDAYIKRESAKVMLTKELKLDNGDEVFSENAEVLIRLSSGTQLNIGKNTQLKLTKEMIDLFKGIIRLKALKDSKVQANGVAFEAQASDFEVSWLDNNSIDLDVYKGEVTVSSPHVHTFVPEIVKDKEGFTYNPLSPSFNRRSFAPKLKNQRLRSKIK